MSAPSYADIVDYYLRDDVSVALFELARSRRLKFFHHCETDPTRAPRARPRGTTLHCVESAAALRERVREAATPVPSYPYAFCPFFGIQASAVNAPGEPERVIGWDWRYELDHPWPRAFWILLPIVALLEHFGVPVLAKYSGRRSLHVIIPAECFPAEMKANADHTGWMQAFDRLGDLFCRFAPFVTPTMMGLAKEMILTAPYSFHRYHPGISLPLSLDEARSFDRDAARLERFPGVHWRLPDPDSPGEGMAQVLDLADRVERSPGLALDVAADVFAETDWETFARRSTPDDVDPDSTLGVLFEGAPGAGREGPRGARLRGALEASDRPACKTARYNGLVAKGRSDLDWDGAVAQRRARCAMLAVWVDDGLDGAFEHA